MSNYSVLSVAVYMIKVPEWDLPHIDFICAGQLYYYYTNGGFSSVHSLEAGIEEHLVQVAVLPSSGIPRTYPRIFMSPSSILMLQS